MAAKGCILQRDRHSLPLDGAELRCGHPAVVGVKAVADACETGDHGRTPRSAAIAGAQLSPAMRRKWSSMIMSFIVSASLSEVEQMIGDGWPWRHRA
jgi:hypothetical protein